MKILKIFLLAIALLICSKSLVFAQTEDKSQKIEERLEAVVTKVSGEKILNDGGVKRTYQNIVLIVTTESHKGKVITVENGKIPIINSVAYRVGDKVSVSVTKDSEGKDTYFITDYIRRDSLYWLFALFIILTLIIGGLRGAYSLLGMFISFIIILFFILPQILSGKDPILIAIISSLWIIPITFYLSHGINKKTSSAVLGTLIALILTGILAKFFIDIAHLSGFSSEDATFLEVAKKGAVQMKGLLLAGIIIGALGVLDDITISQAAMIFQLKDTSPKLGVWSLFVKAMDIGRDHIASMVNTLVLVYTGAALPLLLLFLNNPRPFGELINYELIAEEIVRTLVVSIGLITAVPIVTLIAAISANIEMKRAAKEIFTSLK